MNRGALKANAIVGRAQMGRKQLGQPDRHPRVLSHAKKFPFTAAASSSNDGIVRSTRTAPTSTWRKRLQKKRKRDRFASELGQLKEPEGSREAKQPAQIEGDRLHRSPIAVP